MYKNIFLFILGFAITMAGCNKPVDDLFNKTADERLSDALNAYQDKISEPAGWKVFVYPKGLSSQGIEVGGFSYYMKFNDSNRVTMVSDFDLDMAGTPKESGFRLKAVQRPSIYFDTYSYIHIPADPTFDVNFSPTFYDGYGWGTDFDFAFADLGPSDTIHLKGNFNHSEAIMLRATQAEIDSAFTKGKLRSIMDSTLSYIDRSPFLYIPAPGNRRIGFSFDFYLKYLQFLTINTDGSVSSENVPYSFTVKGIYLKDPVTIGGITFQEMFWDNTKRLYYIVINGARIELVNSPTAVFVIPSLAGIIGDAYTTISVPTTPLPNQSSLFATKYNALKTGVKNGPYTLDLSDLDFVFNNTAKTMTLNMYISQFGNLFVAVFNYTYTVDANGVFKFTRTSVNGNANLILADARNIIDYIDADRFKLDAFLTTQSLLGEFTSIENPTFVFTGYLR